jgi:hypothetical protein
MTHAPHCMICARQQIQEPRHRATNEPMTAPCPSRSSVGSDPERLNKSVPLEGVNLAVNYRRSSE